MASTYFTRTPGSSGSNSTFTISVWLKKAGASGTASGSQILLTGGTDGGSQSNVIYFDTSNRLGCYQGTGGQQWYTTTAKYSDINGWYHIVNTFDSTASGSDKIKLWINGVQETVFTTDNRSSFTNCQDINQNAQNRWGSGATANYFDGYMAQLCMADGTAYAASTFGETDYTTGEWKPKSDGEIRSAVTFGTNGCLLPFSNASYPGYDYQTSDRSGTTNDYTFNGSGFQCKSNPSNNFAVLDHNNYSNSADISKNMCRLNTASNGWFGACSTMGFKKGFACYFETKLTAGSKQFIGVSRTNGSGQTGDPMSNETEGTSGFDYMVRTTADDTVFLEGTNLSGTFSQATTGDIVAMSVSAAGEVKIYKNDTLQYTWSTA